ncbi:FAD-dependent oxidoreductase [Beduinella massiliensis]|uniref:FAD-dependent oxidoreductase n=1 Tax=Beduinella massiliensis TaxID=1852363 RepID=UPI000C8150F1
MMTKKTLSMLLALVMTLCLGVTAFAEDYTATAKGFGGDVTVTLTIEDGKLTNVQAEGPDETAGIGTMAIEQLPGAMVERNSVEVDAVASATVTSTAVLAAAADALGQSGVTLEAAQQAAPAEKESVKPAFENPDVIVIGAGFSGMNAALEAAENGAKVYLIDKNNAMGGSIRFAGGTTSAAGAKMQIAAGVEDSPENFQADIVRMGGGTNVEELTRKHTECAAAAIDWLDSLGADFGDREPKMSSSYDAFNVPREYRVQGGGNAMVELVKPLIEQHVEKGDIALLLETEVADIIVEDGAVKGVVLTDGSEYRAAATILATGGYGHNEELLHRYNYKNVLTMSPSFVTGDGYKFAEKAGAIFNNMDYLPAYPGGVPVGGFDVSCTASVQYPGVIWVDNTGSRMVKELGSLDSERKAAYAGAPENLVYMILTQQMKDTQDPILSVGGGFSGKPDEGWAYFDELLASGNCVYKGETLEELAQNAGIDAAGLAATVEAYNGYVQAGEDKEFGRAADTLAKLEGPFYAIKTCPYVMLTKGGPLMNPDAQTLNADHEPIPGLYQCGELTGGANVGGSANIGGLANTSCIVWGKIAGANAAAYALGK